MFAERVLLTRSIYTSAKYSSSCQHCPAALFHSVTEFCASFAMLLCATASSSMVPWLWALKMLMATTCRFHSIWTMLPIMWGESNVRHLAYADDSWGAVICKQIPVQSYRVTFYYPSVQCQDAEPIGREDWSLLTWFPLLYLSLPLGISSSTTTLGKVSTQQCLCLDAVLPLLPSCRLKLSLF